MLKRMRTIDSTARTRAQENERPVLLVALRQRALFFQRPSIVIFSRFTAVMGVKANAIWWNAW
jgi:hypothetical protein